MKAIIRNDSSNTAYRAIRDKGQRYIVGYASVFNKKSKMIVEQRDGRLQSFFEIIKTGAFDEVLSDDVTINIDHSNEKLLGRTHSGTLELKVDSVGLFFKLLVPETQLGNDVFIMVQRGDYFECSFHAAIKDYNWSRDESGHSLHIVSKFSKLYDVSIVKNGAYANTDVKEYADHVERSIQNIPKLPIEDELRYLKMRLLKLQ